jgi:hypothetical protein
MAASIHEAEPTLFDELVEAKLVDHLTEKAERVGGHFDTMIPAVRV